MVSEFYDNHRLVYATLLTDGLRPCALPPLDAHEWFTTTSAERGPAWRNEITLRSIEMLCEYGAGLHIEPISPTPMMMIIGATDHLAVFDIAFSAFNTAREPKRVVSLSGGHFDPYYAGFDTAASSARDWFVEHLGI